MRILVMGGSGLVGSKLVRKLSGLGHNAVAASPRSVVDAVSGEGLAEAMKGAGVVIDVMNAPSWEDSAVLRFFEATSQDLMADEEKSGVSHHVALFVVGTEQPRESGYFRAKLAQERIIQASRNPYTIVRARQFFEFLGGIADAGTDGGTVRLPSDLMQPMAAYQKVGKSPGNPSVRVRSLSTDPEPARGTDRKPQHEPAPHCPR